jgi:hypothetical protein
MGCPMPPLNTQEPIVSFRSATAFRKLLTLYSTAKARALIGIAESKSHSIQAIQPQLLQLLVSA